MQLHTEEASIDLPNISFYFYLEKLLEHLHSDIGVELKRRFFVDSMWFFSTGSSLGAPVVAERAMC